MYVVIYWLIITGKAVGLKPSVQTWDYLDWQDWRCFTYRRARDYLIMEGRYLSACMPRCMEDFASNLGCLGSRYVSTPVCLYLLLTGLTPEIQVKYLT